jgi:hypothetical protein
MKEFFELKLGSMSLDEYERIFMEFLRYVEFIKDDKFNIQIFLSGLPSIYSDNMQYDEPKTLEEAIKRAKCLYDQHKGETTFQITWVDKKKSKMEKRRKGFKPPFLRNNS